MFETVAYENLKKQEVLTRSPDLKSGPKLFGLDGLRDVEPKKLLKSISYKKIHKESDLPEICMILPPLFT